MFQNEANLVYFFRTNGGIEQVSKEILAGRTDDYRNWVEGLPDFFSINLSAINQERNAPQVYGSSVLGTAATQHS